MSRPLKISLIIAGSVLLLLAVFYVANHFYYQGKTPIKIVAVRPRGEINRKTNLTIEFSQKMVNDAQLNQALDSVAVVFSPPIPGRFKWISTRRLRFYPDLPLKPATEYVLEVLPEICIQNNTFLEGDRQFVFYTERLKIKKHHTNVLFTNKKMSEFKIEAVLQFTDPVDPQQLQNYLTFHADKKALGKKINYTIETGESSKIITVLSEALQRDKKQNSYSFRISSGLQCVGGQLGLTDDFTRTIQVGDPQPLKLDTIYPGGSGRSNWIVLRFSTAVNAEVAAEYLAVEPKTAYRIESQRRYLYLKGNFRPGRYYTVSIKEGLIAQNMSALEKELTQRVFIENLEPKVSFVDQGIYLPRQGNHLVGVETVNIKNVAVEIYKIFENNLVHLLNRGSLINEYNYYDEYGMRYLGQRIYSKEINVQSSQNEPVRTPVDISDFLNHKRKGIFRIVVRDTESRWRNATKWVVATDLGITAHKAADELFVWVNSLSSLKERADAKVTLLSRSNQVLATAQTDIDGLAMVLNLKKKREEFSPFVIVVSDGEDFSFLKFADCRLSTSDFDVSGRSHLVEGYEASLYTDRGIYRPGETTHLVAVVRDRKVAIPPEFPVKLEVLSPDNRLFHEFRSKTNSGGACEFEIALPNYAQTGKYLAKLMVTDKQELGRLQFSVEEFIPDRIKVTLTTEKENYQPDETARITVKAVNLFGPPAAGRKVEANCEIKAQRFSHAKYRSYSFHDPQKSFKKMEIKLGTAKLDTAGQHEFQLKIPAKMRPSSALRAVLSATVTEPGGRAVSAYSAFDIHPYPFYLGLRQQTEGYAKVGEEFVFDYVVIDENGKPQQPGKLQVTVSKIVWQSILKKDRRGYYRYVSESSEQQVYKSPATPTNGKGTIRFSPKNYGQYRVKIRHVGSGVSSSATFYASGWGYAPWSMAHPDRLEIEFDKKMYRVGETAKVLIKAPFSGKLLYWIEREAVMQTKAVTLEENTASLEILVKAGYQPNVYLTATLIRSIKSLEKHAPARAFGTAPLLVDCKDQRLSVSLKSAKTMRSRNELAVEVQVSGTSEQAFVTLAAVDEGICQLTDFKTPDLHKYFYAKKRLQVESFDIYNFILPEFEPTETNSSPAGDRLAGVRKRHLTPVDAKRVKPVSLWSGLTPLGSRGRAKIKFKIPEFNGSLRLMAVVFDGTNFGNAAKNVTVRDPIVLTPTFPRFIAPNDQFQVPVLLANGTGKDAKFTIQMQATGPVEIVGASKMSLSVQKKQEASVGFQLKAGQGMGKVKFVLTAKGGGSAASTSVEMPLRPPAPPISETGSGSFSADKPVVLQLPSNWIPGTEVYQLTTSGFPAVKFAGGLQYLLRYPHGCVEQTTSRVLPLLYFKEIARNADPELFKNNTTEYYVEAGINRLINMQVNSGGFAYWPGGRTANKWGSIYASHFMVEARKAGFSVPNRVYRQMLRYLKREARQTKIKYIYELELRCYALYVLALADRADKSSMIYLKNNELDGLSASSRFLLAGAFGLSGDLKTAKELLPVTIQPQSVERETGRIFNSSVRTNAIILNVLADLAPKNPSVPVLVKWLSSNAKAGRWYNTQDNAWAFLAIGKTMKGAEKAQFTGQIKIGNSVFGEFTKTSQLFSGAKLGGKQLQLAIQGPGRCYFYWQASGIPRDADIKETDHGLQVQRVFLSREGKPLNYQQIKQGDLVIAKITMKALDKRLENVIVADLLPAGLEIENPRLESREDVAWIKSKSFYPDYMDLRDDRLILFVDLPERSEQHFYYALRAVTVGEFTLPPIKAEAMYDPVYSSVSSSGVVKVVGMK